MVATEREESVRASARGSKGPGHGGPARGYSRQPFQPGVPTTLTHGAYSPSVIEQRAEQVHGALLEVAPWLQPLEFSPAVQRYLMATAREAVVHDAVLAQGAKVSPRLVEAASSAARLSAQLASALGLDPTGHSRLRLLLAGGAKAEETLADLVSEGRRVREERTVEAVTVEEPGDG